MLVGTLVVVTAPDLDIAPPGTLTRVTGLLGWGMLVVEVGDTEIAIDPRDVEIA